MKSDTRDIAGIVGHVFAPWGTLDTLLRLDENYKSPASVPTLQDTQNSRETLTFADIRFDVLKITRHHGRIQTRY